MADFYLHRVSEALVPKASANCLPALHAFVLWSQRCEEGDHMPRERWAWHRTAIGGPGLRLRQRILRWPTDKHVCDAAWGHFIWSSFLEDLWTARRWAAGAGPLGDPFDRAIPDDEDNKRRRTAYMELLTTWTPRLSTLMQAWSGGITYLLWREDQGPERLCLATINRQGD